MPLLLASLDEYVDAFEQARRDRPEADLIDFLPPTDDPQYRPVLRELIRIDLEYGWESNRPRSLEDYRSSFPELFSDPDSLQEVAFEDYRLRQQAGQDPSPEDYARRYGVRTDGWPVGAAPLTSVRVEQAALSFRAFLAESSRGAGSWHPPSDVGPDVAGFFRRLHHEDKQVAAALADGLSRFPAPGADFLGFRLLSELGRGAFGRVYLAEQEALAGRLVALKVSPDVGGESQALAQMQHTHVVPVYSVHRAGPVQAVCMPYCGSLTLADVLREVQKRSELPRSGAELAAIVRDRPRREGIPRKDVEPTAEIGKRGYVEAVLWMAGRLADGLHHAHKKGILHRDVKPANVLLADDGTPMLLDFNVAEDVKQRGPGGAVLGGTLPYMAPEQLSAFVTNAPMNLDGRADVYSLGIVLFELLTGHFPYTARPAGGDVAASLALMLADRRGPVPCPRDHNRAVSPAAAAIVRRCLEPDPQDRYPSADALREDVDRHLRDEPLKYAPDRSPAERLRKWARRNPRVPLFGAIAAALLLAVLGGVTWHRYREAVRVEKARQERLHFRDDYRLAQFYLGTARLDPENRRLGVAAAQKALECYKVVNDPEWRRHWRFTSLPAEDRAATLGEAGELLLLLARECGFDDGRAEEGLKLNRLAEECFGDEVPGVVYSQRSWLRCRAGLPDEPAPPAGPPLTVRDLFLEAQELMVNGDFREARRLLTLAKEQQPDHYWVRFMRGICYEWLGYDALSEMEYEVCVALMPDFHAAYLNRGLIRMRQKKHKEAAKDLERVVAAVPKRTETYYDLALARGGARDFEGAIAALDEGQRHGLSATRACLLRAVWRENTDRAAAQRDREEGLKAKPVDEKDFLARGFALLRARKYREALADFDAALALNPRLQSAWMNRANVLAEHLSRPGQRDYLARQEEASEALDRLLDLYPESPRALAGQAVVLARLGDRERAHQRIAAALELDPTGEIRYQAGCVYALTSGKARADAARALTDLRRALGASCGLTFIDPDVGESLYQAGCVHFLESRTAEEDAETALVYLKQAIKMGFGLGFIHDDFDLAALKGRRAFTRLVEAVQELREKKR